MALIDLWPCNNEGEDNCAWDANTMGNGIGQSYVSYDGTVYPVATDADTFITFPVTVDTEAGVMSVNLEQYVVVPAPTEENPDATELQLFATFSRTIDIVPGEVVIEVPPTPTPTPTPTTPTPAQPVPDPAPIDTTTTTTTTTAQPDELAATGMDDIDPTVVVFGAVLIVAGIIAVLVNKFTRRIKG